MKTILIPTDYQFDTLHALEMTWRNSGAAAVQVVLLGFSPVPDSITDYLFLQSRNNDTEARKQLIEEWNTRKLLINNEIQLIEHHQYGASAPIIEQIIERYEVGQVIVPYSLQKSESVIHIAALSAFRKTNTKVLWMPEQSSVLSFKAEEVKRTKKKINELVEG